MASNEENITAEIIEPISKRVKKQIETCIICAEKFNKTKRSPIKCQYCDFIACRKCCETYLLNENDTHCMNNDCGRIWTRQFISNSFSNKFCTSTLKLHRENILFEQNKSSLPSVIPVIKIIKDCDVIDNELKQLMIDEQNIRYSILEKRNQRFLLKMQVTQYYNGDNIESNELKERRTFIRPCPANNCRGFLSSQWKCGICEILVCHECGEIKNNDISVEHICNEENKQTMELLKKDTRPCPKCGTRIFKIEGCFAADVPIKLYSGEIVLSQDVKEGYLLMGDNRTPRKVLKCIEGRDTLYQINQSNKMNYIVNSKHTLAFYKNDSLILTTVSNFQNNILDKENYFGFAIEDKFYTTTPITVEKCGKDKYYGWIVEGANNLFQLEDGTIVHNCNQMFCTNCNTGFDWRTGREIKENIHNPHYFEWLRRTGKDINDDSLNRNINNNCNNRNIERKLNEIFAELKLLIQLKYKYEMYNVKVDDKKNTVIYTNIPYNFWIKKKLDRFIQTIYSIINNTRHLRAELFARYDHNYIREIRELQVEFLMNNLDENSFKTRIQQINKKSEKSREIIDITNILNNTVMDIIYRLYLSFKLPCTFVYPNLKLALELCDTIDNKGFSAFANVSILNEIISIVDYSNSCFKLISHAYKSRPIMFNYILERVNNPELINADNINNLTN
jgi:hypothetical protein